MNFYFWDSIDFHNDSQIKKTYCPNGVEFDTNLSYTKCYASIER